MLDQFTDREIVARTAWGECRSGGARGMQAVINVIVNRANHPTWWGSSMRDVCLKPMQFDCWNTNDPNYARVMSVTEADPLYLIALGLADDALSGELEDITKGATYYFANSISKKPYWCAGHVPCAVIGGQQFYRDID